MACIDEMGWVLRGVFFAVISMTSQSQAKSPFCADALLPLGSHLDFEAQRVTFRLFSHHAERVQVLLFDAPRTHPLATRFLGRGPTGIWETEFDFKELQRKGLWGPEHSTRPIYYGYRLWGPNWKYVSDWVPGSTAGFVADSDEKGNRFNPNKVVLDPYAREVSHDPVDSLSQDYTHFLDGQYRSLDSASVAPKGLVLPEPKSPLYTELRRSLRREIIYEVHVRGFTMQDPSIPEAERGTYRGAARKAKYLRELGVTAVEFLPVHEFQNAGNYWGYMTLNFFSPERNYATEQSRNVPGGVIKEFQDMVEAFHEEGIKVYLDVVYNHTGEGGVNPTGGWASTLSFRGIDNQAYYQTAGKNYQDNSGCGPNFNCANPAVQNLVLDSLKYWRRIFRVDGFRFDLAVGLANTIDSGHGFRFDKMHWSGILNRAIVELPGVDLIAEPWGWGDGTFQLGNFPYHLDRQAGWAEWNSHFRDTIRKSMNRLGVDSISPGQIAKRIAGSDDLFRGNHRQPWHSINFLTAHDGFTLWDLVSYTHPHNMQPAPYGPSDGGESNNHSWDHVIRGETVEQTLVRRRQAARTGMALGLMSLGVPLILGGDEFLRSQRGNNNPWNIDSVGTWFDWQNTEDNKDFLEFTRRLIAFRRSHSAFTPREFLAGKEVRGRGIRDIAWYQSNGRSAEYRDLPEAERGYMDDVSQTFLGYRLDNALDEESSTASVYIGYNWGASNKELRLPEPRSGHAWYWVGDTHASYETIGNMVSVEQARRFVEHSYPLKERSVVLFVERKIQ